MYCVEAEKALSFLPGSLGSILGSQSHLQDIPWLCQQHGESPSNKATGESGLQLSGENDKLARLHHQ